MSKNHSPNDQRSITKNPNNPAYGHDAANRAGQVHAPPATEAPSARPAPEAPAAQPTPPAATPKRS